MRKADANLLVGDASRAAELTGCKVTTDFPAMVKAMVDAEMHAER